MINFQKPLQLRTPTSSEKIQADSRLNSGSPIHLNHLNYWRVQFIVAKDVLSHFWLNRQSKKIINNIEIDDLDNLEKTVTSSFITVPFLMLIWMYFFYRWPTHHPELFSIAIGIPICFVSFRLIQFVRKHRQK